MTKNEKRLLYLSLIMNVSMIIWVGLLGAWGSTLRPKAIKIYSFGDGIQKGITITTGENGAEVVVWTHVQGQNGNISGDAAVLRTEAGQSLVQVVSNNLTNHPQTHRSLSMVSDNGNSKRSNEERSYIHLTKSGDKGWETQNVWPVGAKSEFNEEKK